VRYVLGFAVLMSLLTSHARVRGADYVVVNNVPKYAVVNKAATSASRVKVSTTCDSCGVTGKCLCFAGECACPACGLGAGGLSKQAGKPQGSGTTRATLVPSAVTPLRPDGGTGSSGGTPPAGTSTSASPATLGGTTNGCANGQCYSGRTTTYSRGVFRLR